MMIWLNGTATKVEEACSIIDAISLAGHMGPVLGVAVALNGEVVARTSWGTTRLTDGDRVEVLVAAQGG